jgi:nucleoside-diphosphate-sugar epimerase
MVIYGDGAQTRDFTYVVETADFLVRLLERDEALGDIFNVCRGEEVSVNLLAHLIGEMTGSTVPPVYAPGRPSDVLRLYGDPGRIRELLGQAPQVSIKEGLNRTIEWYREHVPITESVLEQLQPANWMDVPEEPWLGEVLKRQDPARP